ncbi:hypothetical protein [Thiohalorhabdus sp.]|uniref:hypothetical protein n=1 Tax=Thiohalorhabdus sp. TaxID=3094134 RepID=UPI002FC2FBE3
MRAPNPAKPAAGRQGLSAIDKRWLAAGFGLWAVLALPPVRAALEATLAGHMVAQIGLLAVAGWWLGRGLGPVRAGEAAGFNRFGATGVVVAVFVLAFWMLPVSLDRALLEPAWEAGKYLSVPALIGLPLARSWPRLPPLARGLLWANGVSMLVVMGWVYREAPVRLCNSYLLDQQLLLGLTLWGLGVAVAAYWTIRAFAGGPADERGDAAGQAPATVAGGGGRRNRAEPSRTG